VVLDRVARVLLDVPDHGPNGELSDGPPDKLLAKLAGKPADLLGDELAGELPDLLLDKLLDRLSDVLAHKLNDKPRDVLPDVLLDKPADIPANKLNDLLNDKPADKPLEVPIHIPTPGPPTWVETARSMSVFATSAYVRMKAVRKELCMAVKSLRRGLNRETRALLEYVRRVRPANRAYGLPAEVAKAQAHAVVDRIVQSSGLAHVIVDELRWMVDDVARALCSGQGEELAFELDGVLGKWLRFDLEPNTVQLLLRILLREVAGIQTDPESYNKDTKTQSAPDESGEANRPEPALSEPRREERFLDSSDSLEMTRRRGEPNGTPRTPGRGRKSEVRSQSDD
jgi:hypothetical protein